MSGPLLWLLIGAAGGIGALGRLHLGAAVDARTPTGFPWGILAVNLISMFLAGLVHGAGLDGVARALVLTGALGALSSYSTCMLDTYRLGEAGRMRAALANLAITFAAGALAAGLGWAIGAYLTR